MYEKYTKKCEQYMKMHANTTIYKIYENPL